MSWRTISQKKKHDSGSVVSVGVAIRRACFIYNVIASHRLNFRLMLFVCPTGRYMRPFAQHVVSVSPFERSCTARGLLSINDSVPQGHLSGSDARSASNWTYWW